MKKAHFTKRLKISQQTIRVLQPDDLLRVVGGGGTADGSTAADTITWGNTCVCSTGCVTK